LTQAQRASDCWTEFRETLRAGVSKGNWETWLSRLEADHDGDTLVLIAPTEFHLRWVSDKHGELVSAAYRSAYSSEGTPLYRVSDVAPSEQPLPLGEDSSVVKTSKDPSTPTKATNLISRYRFESFVVGQSNRFAWAAAMAVAEQPGAHYNPLFIYGAAGLGKTHLLNAVGHEALEMYPELVVRYVSSENFLNDFIDSIRRKRPDAFKHRYRGVDILLLDDVQFFEGKEQILEEFFHTFNSLYEAGNQLVISSDRAPRDLRTIEDRLRSRFEWGLTTDIQSPDVETRLAILRKNAASASTPVPGDVLEFIAHNVSDNIRELEGALTRVTAFATLTHEKVTLELAANVLRDIVHLQSSAPLTADGIISTVAQYYEIRRSDLTGPSRRQPLARQRQIAMYVCREHTDLSLPRIGRAFGGRDHTTVIHAVEKIKGLIQTDKAIYDQVTEVTQQLGTT
jgi:chromosomal replication initiator protein